MPAYNCAKNLAFTVTGLIATTKNSRRCGPVCLRHLDTLYALHANQFRSLQSKELSVEEDSCIERVLRTSAL